MSVKILPYEGGDFEHVRVREVFQPTLDTIHDLGPEATKLLEGPYAWTAWTQYGTAVAICGIIDGQAWAFVDPDMAPSAVIPVHRKVRQVLKQHALKDGPVFATVRRRIPAAVKWATRLGFRRVGLGSLWVYDI